MNSCYSGLALTRGAGAFARDRTYLEEITRRTARQILTAGAPSSRWLTMDRTAIPCLHGRCCKASRAPLTWMATATLPRPNWGVHQPDRIVLLAADSRGRQPGRERRR